MRTTGTYSFLHSNPDVLEDVQIYGRTVFIPARIGSTYWAILKVAYTHPNQPLYSDELTQKVADVLMDFNPASWTAYCAKPQTKPWKERVIISAQLLTRVSGNHPYGLRCTEQGLVLTEDKDAAGRPYFMLRTNN